jgi:hypothetical protein
VFCQPANVADRNPARLGNAETEHVWSSVALEKGGSDVYRDLCDLETRNDRLVVSIAHF